MHDSGIIKLLVWLIPLALAMGAAGILAFFWSIGSGQYDDLDGAAERVLIQNKDEPLSLKTSRGEHVEDRREYDEQDR